VKELENAMADGRADLAVHSMKDVRRSCRPVHAGRHHAREDPRDAFVSNRYRTLADMRPRRVAGNARLDVAAQPANFRRG